MLVAGISFCSTNLFKKGPRCSLGYCFLGVSLPTVTLPPVTTVTVSDSYCACAISGKGGKQSTGHVHQDGSGGRFQVLCTTNRDHRIWPSVQCNHWLKWQRKVEYFGLHLLSSWDIQLVPSRSTHLCAALTLKLSTTENCNICRVFAIIVCWGTLYRCLQLASSLKSLVRVYTVARKFNVLY